MKYENTRLLIRNGELQYMGRELTIDDLYERLEEVRLQVNELSDYIYELVDTKRGIEDACRVLKSIGQ